MLLHIVLICAKFRKVQDIQFVQVVVAAVQVFALSQVVQASCRL